MAVDDAAKAVLEKCPPEKRLRVRRVSSVTLVKYSEHVDFFLDWCKTHHRPVKTYRQADLAMARFLNVIYEDGACVTSAGYTLFGYILLKTLPDRPERDMMPLSRAALGTWRSSRSGGSRVGMVPQVIYTFADFCASRQQFAAAAAVLIQFDLYATDHQKSWGSDAVIWCRLCLLSAPHGAYSLETQSLASRPRLGKKMM